MLNKQTLLFNDDAKGDYTPFYIDFGDSGGSVTLSPAVQSSFYISYNSTQWSDQPYYGSDIIQVSRGRVYFKAVEPTNTLYRNIDTANAWDISGTGVKLGGNINSLLSADNPNSVGLGANAFAFIFALSNAIVDAAELVLPAKTVSNYGYSCMFFGCVALGTSPIIQAERIRNYGCSGMFDSCSNLTRVTCLAVQTTSSACIEWVARVGSTGTFYKNSANSTWQIGTSGIPEGWVIKDYN